MFRFIVLCFLIYAFVTQPRSTPAKPSQTPAQTARDAGADIRVKTCKVTPDGRILECIDGAKWIDGKSI